MKRRPFFREQFFYRQKLNFVWLNFGLFWLLFHLDWHIFKFCIWKPGVYHSDAFLRVRRITTEMKRKKECKFISSTINHHTSFCGQTFFLNFLKLIVQTIFMPECVQKIGDYFMLLENWLILMYKCMVFVCKLIYLSYSGIEKNVLIFNLL